MTEGVWYPAQGIFAQYDTDVHIGYVHKFNFKLEQENCTTPTSCIFHRRHTNVKRQLQWLSYGIVTL